MTKAQSAWARHAVPAVLLILLLIAAVASLLPLIETNIWWIRLLDFPRLQFAIAIVVLLLVYVALRGRPGWVGVLVILLFGAEFIKAYTDTRGTRAARASTSGAG